MEMWMQEINEADQAGRFQLQIIESSRRGRTLFLLRAPASSFSQQQT